MEIVEHKDLDGVSIMFKDWESTKKEGDIIGYNVFPCYKGGYVVRRLGYGKRPHQCKCYKDKERAIEKALELYMVHLGTREEENG
jgi:hypothetical protein